jgi:Sugar-transfer associated ATP-grasp
MPINPESLARSALKSLSRYRYHWFNTRLANRILKGIEGEKGPLSQQIMKQCNDYAIDVLGHRHFAAWLYVYSAVAGRFKEGWISDNYYGSVVVPKLKGDYGTVARLKSLHSTIFLSNSFPDILSYSNGVFFDTEYRVLRPESLKDKLFADQDQVIFKLDNSLAGKGIFFFNRESFDPSKIYHLGNGLFQRIINQHKCFQEFAQEAVATLRMTTVLEDDGTTSLRACYLRLGTGTDTHVQSKSHIRIPIDIKSGAFNHIGFRPDWLEVDCHPTRKVKFQGRVIPTFDACRKLVTTLHQRVPYARCIGWDVALDDQENVMVMEWNARHNDIRFSEATQGPCFFDLHWESLRA